MQTGTRLLARILAFDVLLAWYSRSSRRN